MINVSNFLGIYIFQTKTILQHIKHKENDKNFLSKCQTGWLYSICNMKLKKIGVFLIQNFCLHSKDKYVSHILVTKSPKYTFIIQFHMQVTVIYLFSKPVLTFQ